MFRPLVAFELRYQIRQPLLWTMAGIFFVLSFIATITDAFAIGGAIGSLNRNAPYVVVRMLGNWTLVGTFVVVAFVATSALRDFEAGTGELVFSRPIRAWELLFARFAGSLLAVCLCLACAALGLFAGSLAPWLDPERVGPRDVRPYLYGLVVLNWPTLATVGAIFFALATRIRHISGVYAALVALLVAYFAATAMFGDLESRRAAAWLDPFGLSAFDYQTRYWTIAEKNTRAPTLSGDLLWNRVAWLALATGILLWAIGTFRYERGNRSVKPRISADTPLSGAPIRWRRERPLFPRGTAWRQFIAELHVETRMTLRSLPFLLIVAFGLMNILTGIGYLDLMMGTPVWPVTYLMFVAIRSGYAFLLNVIIAFYAGEMVWRDRSLRLEGIVDAMPVATWSRLLAKLGALWAAAFVFIAVGMIGLIGYQLSQGYTHLEPGLYLRGLVVETLPFLLIAPLALFFQVVANQKFVGYLLMVLYLVWRGVAATLHFNHYLYRYAETPSAPYSDMNGWGHFVAPLFWFNAYWAFAAGILVCLAYAGWVRGYPSGRRGRLQTARARLRGMPRLVMATLAGGFITVGAFVFYNTNILNAYFTSDDSERRAAEYEKKYRQYRDVIQPRIVSVRTDVDIYPHERRAEIRGSYRLANKSDAPIKALHIGVSPRVKILGLDLPPHSVAIDDRRLGYGIYELNTPLAPGQEMEFGFRLEISNTGFVNSDPDNTVVDNGTFIHPSQFPSLSYLDDRELGDPSQRRRQGLPSVVPMAKIDDMRARQTNDLARDADWLNFEATVSTAADQIALAPGYLEREWTEGTRRYFQYKTDRPIPKFFAVLSARYAVRRDSWNGVTIEIFHDPMHGYNVDRMIAAVKKTLEYMTVNFTPFQDRVVRIAEFPRYARAAVSLPTLIPFSESIGFIARLRNEDAIDYPFYVTAHEVAHQWWGYQVLGADVQGANMLSETMAQYSALMVMRKEYGSENMQRFLRYELDRYLSGRGGEPVEEVPLGLVEGQRYVYYSKGSLALYALQDAIGESRLNDALRRYIASVRFQPPPYTVSRELISAIAAVTPPDRRELLHDLFAAITLFDNRITSAVARPRADGRYEVTVTARARKLRSDGKGAETDVPIDDWIDVGVFGETTVGGKRTDKILFLQKQHVTSPDVTVTAVVDAPPVRAGIDPYNMLIDRTPGDNVRPVTRR